MRARSRSRARGQAPARRAPRRAIPRAPAPRGAARSPPPRTRAGRPRCDPSRPRGSRRARGLSRRRDRARSVRAWSRATRRSGRRDPHRASSRTRGNRRRSSFRAWPPGTRDEARCSGRPRTARQGAARPDGRSRRLWRRDPSRRTGRPRLRACRGRRAEPPDRSSPEADAHGLALADLEQWLALHRDLRVLGRHGAVHPHAVLRYQAPRIALALREGHDNEVHDADFLLSIYWYVDGRDRVGRGSSFVDTVELALRLARGGRGVQLGGDGARELALGLARVQLLARERVERGPHLFHRELGGPLEVMGHELVVDGHYFSVDLARRIHEPDALRGLRLAHLLAVQSLEELDYEDRLRALPDHLLQVPPGEDVEELVGAAELHVRLDRDRVVRLEQRVQEVLDRDRRLLIETLAKFLACEDLLRGES